MGDVFPTYVGVILVHHIELRPGQCVPHVCRGDSYPVDFFGVLVMWSPYMWVNWIRKDSRLKIQAAVFLI